MNLSGFASLVHERCALQEVDFDGPEDFFQEHLLAYIDETWNQLLGQLVPHPPDFRTVIDDLRPQVEALIS